MNQKSKATLKPALKMSETFQREIDFKKYLQLMKINQAKRNDERKRSKADLTTLNSFYTQEQSDDSAEDGYYESYSEEDYKDIYNSFIEKEMKK